MEYQKKPHKDTGGLKSEILRHPGHPDLYLEHFWGKLKE